MYRIIIIGAAGRMGRRLVSTVLATEGTELAGAIEYEGNPLTGQDAGVIAGEKPCGVKITSSLDNALKNADAIIDFSTGTVLENAKKAAAANCAIVIGTTALTDDVRDELKRMGENGARIIQTTNFSVGVNLLFYLAEKTAKILDEKFDIEIVEAHHNQKKDSPSGTAVTLAEKVAGARGLSYSKDVKHGRFGIVGARTKHEIGMHSIRGGDIVGDHTVMFCGPCERVELTHKASNRDTFANGAVKAALFLKDAKPGFYTMQDVLGLK